MKKILYIIFIILILVACDGGLEPNPINRTILRGEIIYKDGSDNWPSPDSIFDLRVVAFKNFPPVDVFQEVLSGAAYFTADSLAYYQNSNTFEIEISDAPVELKYIAVAQQYGTILQWKAIGVYTESGNNSEHSSIKMSKGEIKNISIIVDFNNLPPQPFE